MAGHAARHRMDGVFDLDALALEHVGHLAQGMLGLGHRHAVSRHDDDLGGVLHDIGGILGRALLDGPRFDGAARGGRLAAEAAEDHAHEGAVHALAHDVAEDGARRAHQRARDDQGQVAEREADAGRRPARIGVQHRHDNRHVGAADRHDEQHAERQRRQHDEPEGERPLVVSDEDCDQQDEQRPPSAMLMACRFGSMIGLPDMRPSSLAKAMIEPREGEGADGRADRHLDEALAMDGARHADAEGLRGVERARRHHHGREGRPGRGTGPRAAAWRSSGRLRARQAPIAPPMAMPTITMTQLKTSAGGRYTSVVSTARPMPIMPNRLPWLRGGRRGEAAQRQDEQDAGDEVEKGREIVAHRLSPSSCTWRACAR